MGNLQGSTRVGYSKISDKMVFRHGIKEVKAIYHTTIRIHKSHKKTRKSEIAIESNL